MSKIQKFSIALVGLLVFFFQLSLVSAQKIEEKVETYVFYSHVYDYDGYEKVEIYPNTLSFEKRQDSNQVIFQYTDENGLMLFELNFGIPTQGLWIIDRQDTLDLVFLEKKEYILIADDTSHSVYKFLSIGHGTGRSYLFFISEEYGFLMYKSIFNKWYVELSNHSTDKNNVVNVLISLIRNDKEFYFSR